MNTAEPLQEQEETVMPQGHDDNKDKPIPHLDKIIINDVMDRLGKPKNLSFVTAANLWSNRWRVNVWTQVDVETECGFSKGYRIPHSYFLHYDTELSKITHSDPKIEKLY